jgi:hypothetical protein
MDATRTRLSFLADRVWDYLHRAAAPAAIVLLVVVAALLVRELRVARSIAAAAEPASAAEEVVSVPALVLSPGREIRVGDAKPDTLANVQAQTLVKRTEERGAFGAREVRAYAGFTLVFEPFERAGEPRVAAIYVQ